MLVILFLRNWYTMKQVVWSRSWGVLVELLSGHLV